MNDWESSVITGIAAHADNPSLPAPLRRVQSDPSSSCWQQADELFIRTIDLGVATLAILEAGTAPDAGCWCSGSCYCVSFLEEDDVDPQSDRAFAADGGARAELLLPGLEVRHDPCHRRRLLLSFDGSTIDKALARRGAGGSPEAAASCLSPKHPSSAALRSFCSWLARDWHDGEGRPPINPAVAAAAAKTLLALFLECIAPRGAGDRPRYDLTSFQLLRIERWMQAHLDEPVRVTQLAREVGVSVRAIQDGFRRLRGCPPMQALLQMRLDRARRNLAAGAEKITVTQVAMECGFVNLGRFARQYGEAFGEPPSATLAQARLRRGQAAGGSRRIPGPAA